MNGHEGTFSTTVKMPFFPRHFFEIYFQKLSMNNFVLSEL